jgi:hypothetical protein
MSLKESHEKNDNSSVQRRDKKVEKGSAQTLNPRTIKECSGRDLNPRLRLERPYEIRAFDKKSQRIGELKDARALITRGGQSLYADGKK